jgi:hypothetical protein
MGGDSNHDGQLAMGWKFIKLQNVSKWVLKIGNGVVWIACWRLECISILLVQHIWGCEVWHLGQNLTLTALFSDM